MVLLRLLRILWITLYFGLDAFLIGHHGRARIIFLSGWRRFNQPHGARLRLALEKLGPIFVKFGQMLSTRRDLIPPDIADELAKLQDQVPPFPAGEVLEIVFQAYGKATHEVFAEFNPVPIASASVAQVHFATLPDGTPVAVKILRPGIAVLIEKDLALMDSAAFALEKLWSDGKRLRPREVVAEFAKHLHNELDLMLEAANCSQLHRNFSDGRLLRVPEVYWDYCRQQVMVMERMEGVPISQVDRLREMGINLPRLARDGVEIFFTQVFRDGFFHADMHPGNIRVGADGRYIALDFGIMGTLSDTDKQYLARNFLAFFRRDYRQVALAHIESGWAPSETPPDEFENAIRAVCEPIFDKPLSEISFGRVLLRLFQTSRRFGVEVQPQLVMLQKTLLNIEGLGRQLDPQLDLWATGQPFMERWMREQLGWRALWRSIKEEAPGWGTLIPQIPRLLHQRLNTAKTDEIQAIRSKISLLSAKTQRLQWAVAGLWLVAIMLLLKIST